MLFSNYTNDEFLSYLRGYTRTNQKELLNIAAQRIEKLLNELAMKEVELEGANETIERLHIRIDRLEEKLS